MRMLRYVPAMSHRWNPAAPWFRSAEGRRYLRHFGGLIALKVVLLAVLYFVFVAPQPRTDTSPDLVFDAVRGAPAAGALPAAAGRSTDSQTPREPKP